MNFGENLEINKQENIITKLSENNNLSNLKKEPAFMTVFDETTSEISEDEINEIESKKRKNELSKVKKFIHNSDEFKKEFIKLTRETIKTVYDKLKLEKSSIDLNFLTLDKFKKIYKNEFKLKLKRSCRICLNVHNEQNLINIFSVKNGWDISNAIMELAPIQVMKNELNMPQLICNQCTQRLYSSLEFRRLCMQSDQLLRHINSHTHYQHNQINCEGDEERNYDVEMCKRFKTDLDYQSYVQNTNTNRIKRETNKSEIVKKLKLNDSNTKLEENLTKLGVAEIKEKYIELNKNGAFIFKKYHEYDHQNQKLVNPANKVQGASCNCFRQCYDLIDQTEREEIFKKFWKITKKNKQSSYIHECLESLNVKHRSTKCTTESSSSSSEKSFRRNLTISYRVPIENGTKWLKVCQLAFINLHGLTEKMLRPIIKNKRLEMTNKIKLEKDDQKDEFYTMEEEDEDWQSTGLPIFECSVCLIKYSNERSLKRHKRIKNHFENGEMPTKRQLKKWEANENGEFVCDECSAVFKVKKSFKNHWFNFHKNHSYTCEICGQSFNRYILFQRHKVQHKNSDVLKDERKKTRQTTAPEQLLQKINQHRQFYMCDICNKDGFTIDSLDKHKMMLHFDTTNVAATTTTTSSTMQLQFNCHFCGLSFLHPNSLNEHILLKHYQ